MGLLIVSLRGQHFLSQGPNSIQESLLSSIGGHSNYIVCSFLNHRFISFGFGPDGFLKEGNLGGSGCVLSNLF